MGVEWREFAGKRYLYVDYTRCTSETEMIETYEKQAQQMRLQPRQSLVLSNFSGASVGSEYMKRVNEGGTSSGATMLEKAAFVGLGGLKSILFDGYTRFTRLGDKVKSFDNEADALDWLVSD